MTKKANLPCQVRFLPQKSYSDPEFIERFDGELDLADALENASEDDAFEILGKFLDKENSEREEQSQRTSSDYELELLLNLHGFASDGVES